MFRLRLVACLMKMEELTQEKRDDSLHFDAHEFDGLREVTERRIQGIVANLDQFIRKNPGLSLTIAVVAGFAIASAARMACSRKSQTS